MKTKTSIFVIAILLGVIAFALPFFALQTVFNLSLSSSNANLKTQSISANSNIANLKMKSTSADFSSFTNSSGATNTNLISNSPFGNATNTNSSVSLNEFLTAESALFAGNSGVISNARSTTTNEIPLTAGNVTLSSVTDIYYSNGVLYATDGSYIIALPVANDESNKNATNLNTIVFESTITTPTVLYQNTEGAIDDFAVCENKIIFSKAGLYLYILDTTQEISDTNPASITEYYSTSSVDPIRLPDGAKKIAVSEKGEIFVIFSSFIGKIEVITEDSTTAYRLNYYADVIGDAYAGGGFYVSEDGSEIWYSIDSEIFRVAENGESSSVATAPVIVTEIAVDVSGNVYNFGENLLNLNENSENLANFVNISIDFVNGVAYLTDGTRAFEVSILNDDGTTFITSYKTEPLPFDLNEIAPSTEIVSVLNVDAGAKLYLYKSLKTAIFEYSESHSLLVLNDEDSDYYCVLDTNFGNTAGWAAGYILKNESALAPNQNLEFSQAKVIVNSTKLYNLPNSVALNDSYKDGLSKVGRGDIVEIVSAPIYPTDSSGAAFYAVQLSGDDSIYYIDSRTVVGTIYDNSIDNIVVYNTILRADASIYEDAELTVESGTLEKGALVAILDTKDGISYIQYQIFDENGDVIDVARGYIERSLLNDGSLNATQIVGIVLMCVSIVVAIVVAIVININRKKRKE